MAVTRDSDTGTRRSLKRTWPQRLLIAGASTAGVTCFAASGLVWFAQQRLEERRIVSLEPNGDPIDVNVAQPGEPDNAAASNEPDTPTNSEAPPETFPDAEPNALNILITGADNNACLDPNSPYAGGFGDRGEGFGERSDTIMMWRVNPTTDQVAVLSFPRDLWVSIDGRANRDRINAAYERDEPQRLINTIRQNFDISTDHFVQIDFCAFKELVDAVGGVAVPFETPVRDGATGLFVPEAGCFTFTGEHALAYTRSRKLEYQNAEGIWKRDESSDLGRISRQQDFIRRVGDELLANTFSPNVVRSLLEVSEDYVVTDSALTVDKILELSSILQNTNPADISTYQIEAQGTTIQGKSVLEPRTGGDNMQAILAIFRGEATLAGRPEQVFDDPTGTTTPPATTVPVIDPDAETTTSTEPKGSDPDETEGSTPSESTPPVPAAPDTVPAIEAEDISYGVLPDSTISCT
jgi:LCP family protein required for cell wall assembly